MTGTPRMTELHVALAERRVAEAEQTVKYFENELRNGAEEVAETVDLLRGSAAAQREILAFVQQSVSAGDCVSVPCTKINEWVHWLGESDTNATEVSRQLVALLGDAP